jgi:hypothetical protein
LNRVSIYIHSNEEVTCGAVGGWYVRKKSPHRLRQDVKRSVGITVSEPVEVVEALCAGIGLLEMGIP